MKVPLQIRHLYIRDGQEYANAEIGKPAHTAIDGLGGLSHARFTFFHEFHFAQHGFRRTNRLVEGTFERRQVFFLAEALVLPRIVIVFNDIIQQDHIKNDLHLFLIVFVFDTNTVAFHVVVPALARPGPGGPSHVIHDKGLEIAECIALLEIIGIGHGGTCELELDLVDFPVILEIFGHGLGDFVGGIVGETAGKHLFLLVLCHFVDLFDVELFEIRVDSYFVFVGNDHGDYIRAERAARVSKDTRDEESKVTHSSSSGILKRKHLSPCSSTCITAG